MKCKRCGQKITIFIFGSPDDICWGCLEKEEKDSVVSQNVSLIKTREEKNHVEEIC